MPRHIRSLLLAVALACGVTPAAAKMPKVGEPAPEFELKLMDGSHVKLSELRGQVVVLNFWATWCVPCREELPLLDTWYRLRGPYGLKVFAVTTEDSLPAYRMKPLFGVLAIQPARSVKGPYEVLGGVPTNYIIDRAGQVRYAKAGAFDLDTLNKELVPLLNEPRPAS